jgi:hypothetical protein
MFCSLRRFPWPLFQLYIRTRMRQKPQSRLCGKSVFCLEKAMYCDYIGKMEKVVTICPCKCKSGMVFDGVVVGRRYCSKPISDRVLRRSSFGKARGLDEDSRKARKAPNWLCAASGYAFYHCDRWLSLANPSSTSKTISRSCRINEV